MVCNIETASPNAALETFAMDWNNWNIVFICEFVGETVNVFANHARYARRREENRFRVELFVRVLRCLAECFDSAKDCIVFVQVRADVNGICLFVNAFGELAEFDIFTLCKCNATGWSVIDDSHIADTDELVQSATRKARTGLAKAAFAILDRTAL